MKIIFRIAFVLVFVAPSYAGSYFRLIDPAHPQIGAGLLISPKAPLETVAVTDLALITHSTADGTIIPESWRSVLPPESWVPLQVGFGGSFAGEATIAPGTSANLSPVIAAMLLRGVDSNSSGWAKALKTALSGNGQGQIRLGGALAGVVVRQGAFQSAKAAFPGQGALDIIGRAARVNVGYAWRF